MKIASQTLQLFTYRDRYSAEHQERCAESIRLLIQALQKENALEVPYSKEQVSTLIQAAAVHDIGKLAIPDTILLKVGKLTQNEMEIMKKHTTFGAKLSEQLFDIQLVKGEWIRAVCLHHHERWNGTGYPAGLAGKAIPYPARLMAIVDVYDALTHDRPYKKAYSPEVAKQYINSKIGTYFDPVIAKIFLKIAPTKKPHDNKVFRTCASTF